MAWILDQENEARMKPNTSVAVLHQDHVVLFLVVALFDLQ